MGQLRGAAPYIPTTSGPATVSLTPNEELQGIIEETGLVRSAIENINIQTPEEVDIQPIVDRLNVQIGVIEDFRDQTVAETISVRVAVENAKAVLDQIQATIAAELPNLRAAIAQAATDIQDALTARLNAAVGSLGSILNANSQAEQALATQTNNVLGEIRGIISGANEQLVPRSLTINATQDRQEVMLPAGFVQADVGMDYLTPDGQPTQDGLAFAVETAGQTETVRKRGSWNRTFAPGHLGKPHEYSASRFIFEKGDSTMHVVVLYPASKAPATLVATALPDGNPVTPPAPPSGPSAEELVAGLAGNVTDDGGDPFTEDIVGVWDAINNGLTDFESAVTGEEIQVAQEQPDFTNVIRPLTEAEYNAFTTLTRDQVATIMVANHSRFVRMVGNVYNLSDGAPYTDDHIGLKFAAVNGTFADVTTGANAARIDVDGDGTGDRAITQFEYNSFRALDIGYSQQIQAFASGA